MWDWLPGILLLPRADSPTWLQELRFRARDRVLPFRVARGSLGVRRSRTGMQGVSLVKYANVSAGLRLRPKVAWKSEGHGSM